MNGIKLKTRRLDIIPMEMEEIEQLVETHTGELRQAYSEMLALCREHPEARIWYGPWKIILRKTGQVIGDAGFKGPVSHGAVELGYGLEEAYRGEGYMTEAGDALVVWAFDQKNIYAVDAETEPDNAASQKVLKKLGFAPNGEGEEGPRFRRLRPIKAWMPICMAVGMCLGLALGNIASSRTIIMSVAMIFGCAIGSALCTRDENIRKKALE